MSIKNYLRDLRLNMMRNIYYDKEGEEDTTRAYFRKSNNNSSGSSSNSVRQTQNDLLGNGESVEDRIKNGHY